jgi:hypothetical protein
LPKPVTGPLLVPKLPVSCDCPVFTTAPVVVNAIKFAAVPNVGACPKSYFGDPRNAIVSSHSKLNG